MTLVAGISDSPFSVADGKATQYCEYIVSTDIKIPRAKQRRFASARVNLRIDPQIKAVLVQAADLQQIKLTEFMVKSAQSAAETALAERTRFVLPPRKWREFQAALDSPPREIAALRELFSEPSVFHSP